MGVGASSPKRDQFQKTLLRTARFVVVVSLSVRYLRETGKQVEISSVSWRDWDTGEETDFAEINCEAFYYDGDGGVGAGTPAPAAATATSSTTMSSACVLGGRGGETIASAVGVEEGCKNALASICYTVSLNSLEYFAVAPLAAPCFL